MSKEKLTDEQIALDLLEYAYNIKTERVELQKNEYIALRNLINRLKEGNDCYKKSYDVLKSNAEKTIAELKAENERLR